MRFSAPVMKHWLGSFSIVLPFSGLRGFVPRRSRGGPGPEGRGRERGEYHEKGGGGGVGPGPESKNTMIVGMFPF